MFAFAARKTNIMESLSTKNCDINLDMSVDKVMRERPQTIQIFVKNKMLCIGCALATYHSVDYAAKEHDLDTVQLIIDLNNATATPR